MEAILSVYNLKNNKLVEPLWNHSRTFREPLIKGSRKVPQRFAQRFANALTPIVSSKAQIRGTMNEIHLFAGAGGGILASYLLGHNVIGAVEINDYCCRVLERRQQDGMLQRFPIFQTDIRDFVRSYASLYYGVTDLVSGGFPCQPFSIAGIGAAALDPRNMWPSTIECIRCIRPRYAFLENVPNLLAHEYFGTILGELAEAGYDAEWGVFSACVHGAPHTRERLFILAYSQSERCGRGRQCGNGPKSIGEGKTSLWALSGETNQGCNQISLWGEPIAEAVRMDDGIPPKLDRVRACGNAQVPIVAATAFSSLLQRVHSNTNQ